MKFPTFSTPRILQFDKDVCKDITTKFDIRRNVITGRAKTLTKFVIMGLKEPRVKQNK